MEKAKGNRMSNRVHWNKISRFLGVSLTLAKVGMIWFLMVGGKV